VGVQADNYLGEGARQSDLPQSFQMHTPLTSHAKTGLTGAGDGGSVIPEGKKQQFPAILDEGARTPWAFG
jgi:hypothetical protein